LQSTVRHDTSYNNIGDSRIGREASNSNYAINKGSPATSRTKATEEKPTTPGMQAKAGNPVTGTKGTPGAAETLATAGT
jgi:hypothetical protein